VLGAVVSATGFSAVAIARADTAAGTPAPAAPAAAPATPSITTSGLIDIYEQYQFNNPKNTDTLAGGGLYNVRQTTPTLSLAELNVTTAAAPGKISGKATLISGDTAAQNTYSLGTSNRESRFESVQQLYATYTPETSNLLASVDFGKFYTPFGYEVTESNGNYNYSRSTVYGVLPSYHTGFRLATPTKSNLTTTVYLVDTLVNSATEGVSSNNKTVKGIVSFNYTTPKYSVIESIGAGTDDPFIGATPVSTKDVVNDTDFTYNLDAAHLVGLEYAYISSKPDGSDTTTTNGYAVYYRAQLNTKDAFALRYSGLDTKVASTSTKPSDITATYEIKTCASWLTRFEYRYDKSNVATYLDSSGNVTKDSQSTVIASEVFSF
jgi:hypothetical protein